MIDSKAWNWEIVKGDHEKYWLEPDMIVYYLATRWKKMNKKDFLDLRCGLGRHVTWPGKLRFPRHFLRRFKKSHKRDFYSIP